MPCHYFDCSRALVREKQLGIFILYYIIIFIVAFISFSLIFMLIFANTSALHIIWELIGVEAATVEIIII